MHSRDDAEFKDYIEAKAENIVIGNPNRIVNVYCIYDKEVETWLFPFPAENDKIAIRCLNQYMASGKGLFASGTLDLYFIGSYSQNTGNFTLYKDKTFVKSAE